MFQRSLVVLFLLVTFTFLPLKKAHSDERLRGVTIDSALGTDDIADLAEWGPSLVRFHLGWQGPADTANSAQYLAWLSSALDSLDQLIPDFESHGMKVALNLFTPPGGFASYSEPASHRLFIEAWPQATIIEAWQIIATRYKDSSVVWGYDILNEPAQREVAAGLKDWTVLAQDLISAIRAIDTIHPIIVEPVYGNPVFLKRLTNLTGDDLIFSFHNYYPWKFIHQGLDGVKLGVNYPTKNMNRSSLLKKMRPIIRFQKKAKASIYVGEFTAARWAPKKSGVKYLRDSINIFEKQKWNWTYHAFRGANVWSAEHSQDPDDDEPVNGLTDRAKLLMKYFAR